MSPIIKYPSFILRGIVAGISSLILVCGVQAETTVATARMKDVRVESHFFTAQISGNNNRIASVKDAQAARYVVLHVQGTMSGDSGVFFATDFVLSYSHLDGKEDRTKCAGIGTDSLAVGEVGIQASGPKVNLWLAFYIERDVEDINMYRLGVAESMSYHIGRERPTSVFLTTNRGSDALQPIAELIRSGGYYLDEPGTSLVKEEKGITIHYNDQSETQARELSQRLMAGLRLIPTLKSMSLGTKYDIVVWVGSESK